MGLPYNGSVKKFLSSKPGKVPGKKICGEDSRVGLRDHGGADVDAHSLCLGLGFKVLKKELKLR